MCSKLPSTIPKQIFALPHKMSKSSTSLHNFLHYIDSTLTGFGLQSCLAQQPLPPSRLMIPIQTVPLLFPMPLTHIFSQFSPATNHVVPFFNHDVQTNKLGDIVISLEGVLNLILNLDTKKSPGSGGMPNFFLVRYFAKTAHYLTVIFQKYIDCSEVPSAWKTMKVLPL